MTVRIRLQRLGKPHKPSYRVVAIDQREKRNGKPLEVLGNYYPLIKDNSVVVKKERVDYWISQGAQPSETVASLLKRAAKLTPILKESVE